MKLITRFQLLFVVLIFTFTSISVITLVSLGKINRLNQLDKDAQYLFSLSLEMRQSESNYFSRDLKNEDYFRTGHSQYIEQMNTHFDASDQRIKELSKIALIKNSQLKNDLGKIQQLKEEYMQIFQVVQRNKYELGYEEWGLVGDMEASAKNIGKLIMKVNNPDLQYQLLVLSQFETDYLLKRNYASKAGFDKHLFNILKNIPKHGFNRQDEVEIIRALRSYGSTFSNYVDKDIYTGFWSDEGLMAELDSRGNTLNLALEDLNRQIGQKTSVYLARARFTLLLFIVLFAAAALLIGLYILKRIMKLMGGEPETVARIAFSISKGDLRIGYSNHKGNKGLMKYVLVMAENLKEIISGIFKNARQISQALQQFTITSNMLSQGSGEQASYIDEIAKRLSIIAGQTSKNAINAQETQSLSLEVKEEIDKIEAETEASLKVSKSIAEKVAVINLITMQTRILALNAAVEAARAGKAGDGFQVIADEVRRLADVTRDAAEEIVSLTSTNFQQSKQVSGMVHKMIPLIESNTYFIQSIAQSSREQHENILHVDRTIQKLNYMSQEHAVAAEELASGTEELEEQMHQLTQMVAYFKFDGQEPQQTTNARNNQPSPEKKKVIKIWKKNKKKKHMAS